MLTLTYDTISKEDIDGLADWLKTYPRLTKGQLTQEFEQKFAQKVGSKHAVFVNSGSSANLLAVACWQQYDITTVVVPSLCWITDLSPVIQLGMHPVIVDCDKYNLSINVDHFKEIVHKHKPQALILVSVLGLQPNMTEIMDICKENNIRVLEDACESFGSTFNGKWLGTFGEMGTFSFYYSHHLSTIEGGMVVTDDEELYMLLTMMRAHGWDRDLEPAAQQYLRSTYNIDDFSAKFTFYLTGFNLRPTEIQSYLGLRQLERADAMVQHRFAITKAYRERLKKYGVWQPKFLSEPDVCSGFGWPVISNNRPEIVEKFNKINVETRPLIAGSIRLHPILENHRYHNTDTPVADAIHRQGLYLPIHTGMNDADVEMVCDIILEKK